MKHGKTFALFLVLLFSTFGIVRAQMETSEEEYNPSEESSVKIKPWKTRFAEDWISPTEYMNQYQYVEQMRDEFSIEKRRGLFTARPWQGIGPGLARTGSSNINFLGRIRSFHWYFNIATLQWEPYAGASSGGLWLGNPVVLFRVWTSLGDKLPNPSVGAFAIDPGNPNKIFVGTGDWNRFTGAGLFRTTNRGQSWDTIAMPSIPRYITDLFYDPVRPNIMWLSSSEGVFKSTDSGSTWNVSPLPYGSIFDLVIHPQNTDTLYAASGFAGYAGYTAAIFRTTNGGTSWAPMTNGLPSASTVGSNIALDISRSNPAILYAAFPSTRDTLPRGIYKTTDNGNSWNITSAVPGYMSNGQSFHANVIRVHPTNPNKVYAGSVNLIRTSDGGASWSTLDGSATDVQMGHADMTGVDFDPTNPNLVYLLNDGGVFVYNDATNTVTNQFEIFTPNSPIQSYELEDSWSDRSLIVSGTQDNGTMKSNAPFGNSAEWKVFGGCDGGNNVSIDPNNANNFFFNSWCGPSPRIRSLDRGESTENIDRGLKDVYYSPIGLNKGNPAYLYTIDTASVFFSTNQGNSWTRADNNITDFSTSGYSPRGMAVNNAFSGAQMIEYVWFWQRNPDNGTQAIIKVLQGTPGALAWRITLLPNFAPVMNIGFDRWAPYTAYAFTDATPFRVFRTTNANEYFTQWSDITGNLPNVRKYDIVSSPTNPAVMYIGTDLGVFKTTTGGTNWYKFQYGLPIVPINNIIYTQGSPYDTLRIGTFGRGFWQRTLSGDDPQFLNYAISPLFNIISNGNFTIATGAAGTILRSSNNGGSWDLIDSPVGTDLSGIAVIESVLTSVGKSGVILHSTNNGKDWQQISSPTSNDLKSVYFMDKLIGVAAGKGGTILRTTDGGWSWETVSTGFTGTINAFASVTPDLLWASGEETMDTSTYRVLMSSTDSGKTWNANPNFSGLGKIVSLKFFDVNHGFALDESGILYKTTDMGDSWEDYQIGSLFPLKNGFFADNKTGWVCGDGGTLFKTIDGGTNWVEQETGTDATLYALNWINNTLFYASDSGVSAGPTQESFEASFSVKDEWNMIAIPVQTNDLSTTGYFPTSTSAAFSFDNGYRAEDVLEAGKGYWLKFDQYQTITRVGQPFTLSEIEVNKGWNMIGVGSDPVYKGDINSSPMQLVISPYFGYSQGYYVADTLKPGAAYWVKTWGSGTLLPYGFAKQSASEPNNLNKILKASNEILFGDQGKRKQKLYFSTNVLDEPALSLFEMPPVPPAGGFDVRFGTKRMVEGAYEQSGRQIRIDIQSDKFPVTIHWNMKNHSQPAILVINDKEIVMEGSGSATVPGASSTVSLKLDKGVDLTKPATFALQQNYPNPFNPATAINYQLPVSGYVSLKVYNILGEEVATLIDGVQNYGFKSVTLDASKIASGLYFYRLRVTNGSSGELLYSNTKKAMLIK